MQLHKKAEKLQFVKKICNFFINYSISLINCHLVNKAGGTLRFYEFITPRIPPIKPKTVPKII